MEQIIVREALFGHRDPLDQKNDQQVMFVNGEECFAVFH
jgi:hypothetical protein